MGNRILLTVLVILLILSTACGEGPIQIAVTGDSKITSVTSSKNSDTNIFDKTTGKAPASTGKRINQPKRKLLPTPSPTAVPRTNQQKSLLNVEETVKNRKTNKINAPIIHQKSKSNGEKLSTQKHQLIHIRNCLGSGGPIVDPYYAARFCSIDEAILFIRNQPVDHPILIIEAGRYTIAKTIDREVTIRASDQLNASEKVIIAPSFPFSEPSCCTLRIAMKNPNDKLTLSGLHIATGYGLPALFVSSGKVDALVSDFAGSIILQGKSSTVELTDVSVSGQIYTEDYELEYKSTELDVPTLAHCKRSGIAVLAGAELKGSSVTISGTSPLGICVSDPDSRATLNGSNIADIKGIEYSNRWVGFGWGGFVGNGGELRLVGSIVNNTRVAGLVVDGTGSQLDLSDGSTVSNVRPYGSYPLAVGLLAQNHGEMNVLNSEVTLVNGVGLLTSSQGSAFLNDSLFDENNFAGIVVTNGILQMIGGKVINTKSLYGVGVVVQADPAGISNVSIRNSVIARNSFTGILLNGGEGTTIITKSSFRDNGENWEETPGWNSGRAIHVDCYGFFNHPCLVRPVSAIDLILTENMFSKKSQLTNLRTGQSNSSSGDLKYVHVFLNGSNATLTGNSYIGGGIDVQQQKCSYTDPVDLNKDGAIRNNLCPQYDDVSGNIWFSLKIEDPVIFDGRS